MKISKSEHTLLGQQNMEVRWFYFEFKTQECREFAAL
jgi:hypothetical protein